MISKKHFLLFTLHNREHCNLKVICCRCLLHETVNSKRNTKVERNLAAATWLIDKYSEYGLPRRVAQLANPAMEWSM